MVSHGFAAPPSSAGLESVNAPLSEAASSPQTVTDNCDNNLSAYFHTGLRSQAQNDRTCG